MRLEQYKEFFIQQARLELKEIERLMLKLEQSARRSSIIDDLLHAFHKLKGSAATMRYMRLATAVHLIEDFFIRVKAGSIPLKLHEIDALYLSVDAFRSDVRSIESGKEEIDLGPATAFALRAVHEINDVSQEAHVHIQQSAAATDAGYEPQSSYVEVSSEQLEAILSLVNELISQNQQLQRAMQIKNTGDIAVGLRNSAGRLSLLRQSVIEVKMMPVRQYFVFLSRLVRDVSRKGKKFVALEFRDNKLRLERNVLESLRDVCTQLVKNAVDHGFGMGETGTVSLQFGFKSNSLSVIVSDTGHGIDWPMLERRAVERRLVKRAEIKKMPRKRRQELLFTLGVTSRTVASLESGRGIGWSSVRAIVERLGGSIEVESSQRGKRRGTSVRVTIPLAPTMFRAVIWRWGNFYCALPLFVIEKVIQLDERDTVLANGKKSSSIASIRQPRAVSRAADAKILRYRGNALSVISPSAIIGEGLPGYEPAAYAVVAWEGVRFAVPLPGRIEEQELVMQPLECMARNPFVLGAAVTEYSVPVVVLNVRHLHELAIKNNEIRQGMSAKKRRANSDEDAQRKNIIR